MKDLIVIKVGTSTLTKKVNEKTVLDEDSFALVARQIMQLRTAGTQVVLVSSAAITAGMVAMARAERPAPVAEGVPVLQALATVGWRTVLNAWASQLAPSHVGELLITRHELRRATEASELVRVIQAQLAMDIIPVVNENDSITHEEITFGDNDMLAAELAVLLKQSSAFTNSVSVVLLSNIDGVYQDAADATSVISEIDSIDEYMAVVSQEVSQGGTGGMVSKFAAARYATSHGVPFAIANGRGEQSIQQVQAGRAGTRFTVQ